jgi:inner membrane protein
MSPVTHFLAGWAIGLPVQRARRDRALVVLASVAPDVDGLPVLIDFVQGRHSGSLELWSRFHHAAAHNLTFAVGFALICLLITRRRLVTAMLALLAIHLHFLCDILGSRGPDGGQWPIPYLMPFSHAWQLSVGWQWGLNAWPNFAITAVLLGLTLYAAWARGYSPVGLFSTRADQAIVATLRRRFGSPRERTCCKAG